MYHKLGFDVRYDTHEQLRSTAIKVDNELMLVLVKSTVGALGLEHDRCQVASHVRFQFVGTLIYNSCGQLASS